MSETSPPAGEAFRMERIRELVELMEQHDLSEVDLKDGHMRIRLRRGPQVVSGPVVSAPAAASPAPAPAASTPSAAEPEKPDDESRYVFIRSPMVGTFYAAPKPEEPPYVKVGDHVNPDTTVCIIEAMKVFNEIQAETSGRIVQVLVENGEPVEYNQPLFKVDPNG